MSGPDLHTVALLAARAGADAINRVAGGSDLAVRTKTGPHDLVTAADEAADAVIRNVITLLRPDDTVVTEESTRREGTSGVTWYVDPLDGTANFVQGRSDYAVSVAAHDVTDPTGDAGVIYRPADGVWLATTATDDTAGSLPAGLSDCDSIRNALVAVGLAAGAGPRAEVMRLLAALLPGIRDIRRSGSAACDLLSVAAGLADAYIGFNLAPWDWAAGQVLISGLGGSVVEAAGPAGLHVVIAGSGPVVAELQDALKQ